MHNTLIVEAPRKVHRARSLADGEAIRITSYMGKALGCNDALVAMKITSGILLFYANRIDVQPHGSAYSDYEGELCSGAEMTLRF